jgi:hypothetical protein
MQLVLHAAVPAPEQMEPGGNLAGCLLSSTARLAQVRVISWIVALQLCVTM